jgi:hypothetical protein
MRRISCESLHRSTADPVRSQLRNLLGDRDVGFVIGNQGPVQWDNNESVMDASWKRKTEIHTQPKLR